MYLVIWVYMVLLLSRFETSCSASLKGLPISVTSGCVFCCSPLPIVLQVPPAKLMHVAKGETSRFS